MEDLLRVEKIEAFIMPTRAIPVIVCYLEDNRQFVLYSVPPEVVASINKIQGVGDYAEFFSNGRENIFDILPLISEVKNSISDHLERVVIDELSQETGLFSASVELKFDGVLIQKKMIPSHAIYLALVSERPVFVKRELVDEQEKEREGEEHSNP